MHQNTRTSAEVVKTWLTAAFVGLSLPGCMRMSEAERRELRISAKDAPGLENRASESPMSIQVSQNEKTTQDVLRTYDTVVDRSISIPLDASSDMVDLYDSSSGHHLGTRDTIGGFFVTSGLPTGHYLVKYAKSDDGESRQFKVNVGLPITLESDMLDDLIRVFRRPNGTFAPLREAGEKESFDAYFSRLKSMGISRLIIWSLPLPILLDAENFYCRPDAMKIALPQAVASCGDWQKLKSMTAALVSSAEFNRRIDNELAAGGSPTWNDWREVMRWRLQHNIGAMVRASAQRNGIDLAFTYRPLEQTGSKYYQTPVFASNGDYILGFSPLSTPESMFHADEIGMENYRRTMAKAGKKDLAVLDAIVIPMAEAEARRVISSLSTVRPLLEVCAKQHAPLDKNELVLVQTGLNVFETKKYSEIESLVEKQTRVLTGVRGKWVTGHGLVLENLNVPEEASHIWIRTPKDSQATVSASWSTDGVRLWSRSGTELGRSAVSWVRSDHPSTEVAGIDLQGGSRSEFFAQEASQKVRQPSADAKTLMRLGTVLVVSRGDAASNEILDFERSSTRAMVVRQVHGLMTTLGAERMMLSSRSHTEAFGGVHLAYLPLSARVNPMVVSKMSDALVEQITMFTTDEFDPLFKNLIQSNTCQSPSCTQLVRLTQNIGYASGIRKLLEDLENMLPTLRIQIQLPEPENVTQKVVSRRGSRAVTSPLALISGANYSPWFLSEGLALISLNGLRTLPVIMGLRNITNSKDLDLYFELVVPSFARLRGSISPGHSAMFYEAQYTISSGQDSERTAQICKYLNNKDAVGEVILYESADYYAYRHDAGVFNFPANCPPVTFESQ